MPACWPRSSDFRVLLRVSIGSTQILAVELDQIEGAQGHGAAAPSPADQVEYCKSLLVTGDGLAVDYAAACRQRRDRGGDQREAASKIGRSAVSDAPSVLRPARRHLPPPSA